MLSTALRHSILNTQALRSYREASTLLLVDDDPTVLAVLDVILTREGYRVIAAGSPVAALELASENTVSMLITDFQMPGMNGFTLASSLTGTRAALPVLVLSGSHPDDLPTREIAARHWNFMAKPVNRERLLHIVDGECLGQPLQRSA